MQPTSMTVVDLLLERSNRWLAANSNGGSDKEAWEAANAILDMANPDELGSALEEILKAAKSDDSDARNIVGSFGRLHPPQALSNPHRQRELVGLYLVLRKGGLWDTSDALGKPVAKEEISRMLD
jgi:hypothetical protein